MNQETRDSLSADSRSVAASISQQTVGVSNSRPWSLTRETVLLFKMIKDRLQVLRVSDFNVNHFNSINRLLLTI